MLPKLMERTEATAFILDGLRQAYPNAVPEPVGDDRFKIWFTGLKSDVDCELHIGEALNTFESSNDVNVLIDFMNTCGRKLQSTMERGTDMVVKPVYATLLPIIRHADFSEIDNLLEDKLSNEFKVVYAEVNKGKLNWVTKHNLQSEMNHDDIADKAFKNLKQQTWVKQQRVVSGPGAKFFVFENDKGPYQSQFLIKDWTEKYLGKRFFFTFPNEHVTLVMVPTPGMPQGMEHGALGALTRLADDFYHTSDNAITCAIHSMVDGKVKLLGGNNGGY